MTHARTLPRYIGIAGLVAGLLAPVPSLAVAPGATAEILTVGASGQSTSAAIGAKVNAAYRHAAGTARYYKNLSLMIPRAQLRQGALAVLSAGRLLPGLGIAVTAAGLFIAESGDIMKSSPNAFYSDWDNINDTTGTYTWGRPTAFSSPLEYAQDYASGFGKDVCYFTQLNDLKYGFSVTYVHSSSGTQRCSSNVISVSANTETFSANPIPSDFEYGDTVDTPASEEDLEDIDEHLPDEIVDEIADEAPEVIPAWTEEISIVPDAAAITSDVAAAPAVYEGVSEWANAMSDAMEGTTNEAVDGKTASEAAYEASLDDTPPPPTAYPARPEPEWNINIIDDLPSYDAGLGGGTCPAPNVIDIPLYGTITLDWQPACDLAGMIRGPLIGICFIAALYIVLGQSRSSES